MRIITAPLALEVTFAVAAARWRLVRAVLGAEALRRDPSRNLRAVDREVLVRQQAAHLVVVQSSAMVPTLSLLQISGIVAIDHCQLTGERTPIRSLPELVGLLNFNLI